MRMGSLLHACKVHIHEPEAAPCAHSSCSGLRAAANRTPCVAAGSKRAAPAQFLPWPACAAARSWPARYRLNPCSIRCSLPQAMERFRVPFFAMNLSVGLSVQLQGFGLQVASGERGWC